MMEFVTGNWGGLVSVVGLAVSVVGLIWAIVVARGARSASQAAHKAAREAVGQIARHLQTVDLERAIGLIQRIKLLHDIAWWEAAMEQYQALRAMLSDIIARCPEGHTERRQRLNTARMRVRSMENLVRERINQSIGDTERANLNRELNEIQSDLEELASELGFGDPQEGAK